MSSPCVHRFDIDSQDSFFTNAERSLIVKEILDRTIYTDREEEEVRFGEYCEVSGVCDPESQGHGEGYGFCDPGAQGHG